MQTSFINDLLNSLPVATFILEILAFIAALYFKKYKESVIILLFFCTRLISLFTNIYQFHNFISIFNPLFYVILACINVKLINYKSYASLSLLGILYFVLAFSLQNNTQFNILASKPIFLQHYAITDLFCIIFVFFFFYILFAYFVQKFSFSIVLAYIFAFIQFVFYKKIEDYNANYFEFSSLIFIIFIAYESKKMVYYDALTGVLNRRAFDMLATKENSIIAICDIDFFKKVNDTYGHDAGDLVLKEVAKVLKKNAQAYRFGGEEFILLFYDMNYKDCINKLNDIRLQVQALKIQVKKNIINVTISMGACLVNNFKNDALKIADERLYKAKQNGRNRVIYE